MSLLWVPYRKAATGPLGKQQECKSLELEPEARRHFAPAHRRDVQRPTIEILGYPFPIERDTQQRGAQRSANVRPAFAPVHTRVSETPAQIQHCSNVDLQPFERLDAARRKLVALSNQPSQPNQTVVERHAQRARHVVIAGPRQPQPGGRIRHELRSRTPRQDTQALECSGHARTVEAVVTMLALRQQLHQTLVL